MYLPSWNAQNVFLFRCSFCSKESTNKIGLFRYMWSQSYWFISLWSWKWDICHCRVDKFLNMPVWTLLDLNALAFSFKLTFGVSTLWIYVISVLVTKHVVWHFFMGQLNFSSHLTSMIHLLLFKISIPCTIHTRYTAMNSLALEHIFHISISS